MFKHLSLTARVGILVTGTVLLLAALVVITALRFRAQGESSGAAIAQLAASQRHASRLAGVAQDTARLAHARLAETDVQVLRRQDAELARLWPRFQQELAPLKQGLPQWRSALDGFEAQFRQMLSFVAQQTVAMNARNAATARAWVRQRLDPVSASLNAGILDLGDQLQAEAEASARSASAKARSLLISSIVWGLLIAVVGAGLCLMMVRQWIDAPLEQLVAASRRLAEGRTDADLQFGDRADELGEIARGLRLFRRALAEKQQAEALLKTANKQNLDLTAALDVAETRAAAAVSQAAEASRQTEAAKAAASAAEAELLSAVLETQASRSEAASVRAEATAAREEAVKALDQMEIANEQTAAARKEAMAARAEGTSAQEAVKAALKVVQERTAETEAIRLTVAAAAQRAEEAEASLATAQAEAEYYKSEAAKVRAEVETCKYEAAIAREQLDAATKQPSPAEELEADPPPPPPEVEVKEALEAALATLPEGETAVMTKAELEAAAAVPSVSLIIEEIPADTMDAVAIEPADLMETGSQAPETAWIGESPAPEAVSPAIPEAVLTDGNPPAEVEPRLVEPSAAPIPGDAMPAVSLSVASQDRVEATEQPASVSPLAADAVPAEPPPAPPEKPKRRRSRAKPKQAPEAVAESPAPEPSADPQVQLAAPASEEPPPAEEPTLPESRHQMLPGLSLPPATELPLVHGVDLADAMSRLNLSLDAVTTVLARFGRQQRKAMTHLRDALEEEDAVESRQTAKMIADEAGNVAALTMRRLAKTLEFAIRDRIGNYSSLYAELEEEASKVFDAIHGLDKSRSGN